MHERIIRQLTINALKMALGRRKPAGVALLYHLIVSLSKSAESAGYY
jgi:hypothetical protein